MNEKWNMSGLIIEGICGTGKTVLLNALIQSERFVKKNYPSSVILSEHQTQRVLERKEREEGLTVFDNIRLLDQHISYLEQLNLQLDQMQWCRYNQTDMRIPYILERFHFTHVYHYDHMLWNNVIKIDQRLAGINCKTCILTVNSEILASRLFTGRDETWMNYLKRFGSSREEILDYFVRQQDQLLNLVDISDLETLVIDASYPNTEKAVEIVLDFWGAC